MRNAISLMRNAISCRTLRGFHALSSCPRMRVLTTAPRLSSTPGTRWARDGLSLVESYATLGLSRFASTSEVKSAYRKLSLVYHPDKTSAFDSQT